jgi:alkanesulfonate monooxygenase SsuD/methylene tetrahydromethanopterin reductase-like flavin-dependent oxidoreductase (luciferase family)
MKLGLFSMPCHPPHRKHVETFEEDLELVVLADQLGYDEAWLGEHYTSTWENIPAPDLVLAQAILLTERIVLATGVSCIPDHNPAQLAHRIAQLDVMAKGRFMWGVGVGAFFGDSILFEVPQDGTHRRVTHENVDAILKIWASDGDEGYEWRSENDPKFNFTIPRREDWRGIGYHMKPFQKPHPPIAVAGLSASSTTLRWAGEYGWIPMSIHIIGERDLIGHWKAYEESAVASGLEPKRSDWRICRDVYVADTDEQARQELLDSSWVPAYRDYLIPSVKSFNVHGLWKDDPNMPDEAITPEHIASARAIVGSPDTVARQLRSLYERVGGFGGLLMLCYDWEGEDGPRWRHSMELLGKEVMPQLADLTGEPAMAGSKR